MKTAGEIAAAIFDEQFMKKAGEYSKLHNSWADITAKNGVAAAADHSRIKNVDKGILLIETDHPGWKQLLQTKQTQLLDDFRRRFPDLDITGISLMLGHNELQAADNDSQSIPKVNTENETVQKTSVQTVIKDHVTFINENIKDEVLREKLISLGQTMPT